MRYNRRVLIKLGELNKRVSDEFVWKNRGNVPRKCQWRRDLKGNMGDSVIPEGKE